MVMGRIEQRNFNLLSAPSPAGEPEHPSDGFSSWVEYIYTVPGYIPTISPVNSRTAPTKENRMELHISVQKSLIIFCDHYGPNISNRIKSISFILVPPATVRNKPLIHKCSSHEHSPIRVRCSSNALFNAAHPASQPAGQPTSHSFQPQIFILCYAVLYILMLVEMRKWEK